MPTQSSSAVHPDVGTTWMMVNYAVVMNACGQTKAFVKSQTALAHPFFQSLCDLLEVSDESGGFIIEKPDYTLMLGNFVVEGRLLSGAEGELIHGELHALDYCITRF
jgi:hypothetical protein